MPKIDVYAQWTQKETGDRYELLVGRFNSDVNTAKEWEELGSHLSWLVIEARSLEEGPIHEMAVNITDKYLIQDDGFLPKEKMRTTD